MKNLKILLLILFYIIGSGYSFSQTVSDDEETLRNLKEKIWPKAYQTQDVTLLELILAEEFQMIDASGNVFTKVDEITYIKHNKPGYDSFEFKIERLDIFENQTAIISGTGIIEGKDSEGDYISTYRSSNVLIKRGKDWKAVSSHVSGIHTIHPGKSGD